MAPDVAARFARLEKSLRKLNQTATNRTRDTFLNDDDLQDVVLRNFHVGLEALIDLGNHLVASKALSPPDSNAGVFTALADAGLIDADLATKMVGWAGFGNTIVHGYADLDFERVWDILTTELDDLYQAAAALGSHLGLDTSPLPPSSST